MGVDNTLGTRGLGIEAFGAPEDGRIGGIAVWAHPTNVNIEFLSQ
jgi:hypothetical protein